MTKTRDKLNEAVFFWHRMKETQDRPDAWTPREQDTFRYYHSAFLSSARSVTKLPDERDITDRRHARYDWYLEKDFGSAIGFDGWYQKQYHNLHGDALMRFFKDQRDITIHYSDRRSVALNVRVHSDVQVRLLLVDPSEVAPPVSTPEPKASGPNRAWVYADLPAGIALDNEVLFISKMYLTKLQQLVDECENLFS